MFHIWFCSNLLYTASCFWRAIVWEFVAHRFIWRKVHFSNRYSHTYLHVHLNVQSMYSSSKSRRLNSVAASVQSLHCCIGVLHKFKFNWIMPEQHVEGCEHGGRMQGAEMSTVYIPEISRDGKLVFRQTSPDSGVYEVLRCPPFRHAMCKWLDQRRKLMKSIYLE